MARQLVGSHTALSPALAQKARKAVPHVVMGNCAVAGTHKEVVACDIQRVSFVGAGRTEQFTSGDREMQVLRLHPAVLLSRDDKRGKGRDGASP